MKRMILAVIGIGVLVGLGFYLNRPAMQAVSAAAPAEEPTSALASQETQAAQFDDSPPEAPPPQSASKPSAPTPMSQPVTAPATPAPDNAFLSRTVDALVSSEFTLQQKREAWKALREADKLDLAIAELEQRTANNPDSAQYAAALGKAYLEKCGAIQDVREKGILAMQADKLFDKALSLDPSNWEARFTKAVAMSYWPPFLNKSDEVVQHFQTLIQQQENQPQQPQFAETYIWLGEQYQRAGRSDDALATWQRGSALFPTNEKLRSKLTETP